MHERTRRFDLRYVNAEVVRTSLQVEELLVDLDLWLVSVGKQGWTTR